MYEISWSKNNTVEFCGHELIIPDRPSKKTFKNYGKVKKNQYFEHTPLTEEYVSTLPYKEQERLILAEWHKRLNGEWWLINGEEVYIPGPQYHFLNYWWLLEVGTLPNFYYRNTLTYYLINHYLRDERVDGIVIGKGRRMNITEISEHSCWEFQSRTRNTKSIHLNKNEDDSLEDFKRVKYGHQRQPFFFKPISPNDNPSSSPLKFEQITRRNYNKDIEKARDHYDDIIAPQIEQKVQGLDSYLHYPSTTQNVGDGKAYQRVLVHEFAKIDPHRMNVHDHWFVIQPTMRREGKRVGFAIYESTAEDMLGGETLRVSKKLWKKSSLEQLNKTGATDSGMVAAFMSFAEYGISDEYGMLDKEKSKEFIKFKERSAAGDSKDLLNVRRKFPTKEEDMWAMANDQSPFNLLDITNQSECVDAEVYLNGQPMIMPERGDLIWQNGLGSNLVWQANPNGAFIKGQDPIKPNASVASRAGRKAPAMRHIYAMGVDPYNTIVEEGRKSDGAAVMFRKFDMMDEGISEPHKIQTNQPVMIYAHRRENPEDFYEDMLKMAMYYGAPMLFESNRSGIENYFIRVKYDTYLMRDPKNKKKLGKHAGTETIAQYVEYIKTYLYDYIQVIRYAELLDQLKTFTQDKRGRTTHDLVVAFGYALIAAAQRYKEVESTNTSYSDWMPTNKGTIY